VVIKILKIKFSFLMIFSIILITSINICGLYLFTSGTLTSQEPVIIKPKSSILDISCKLHKHKVIKYPLLFYGLAKLYSFKYPLKSGEYMFTPHISPFQVMRILTHGKSIVHKLIVLEGGVVNDVITAIAGEKRLFGEVESVVPEGYLMPDTYHYSYGDYKERLITQMRNKMSLALDEAMLQLKPDSPIKTRMEVLTLASIVEKEAGLDVEKPMIAAVFLNRLKKNMKLQADPTTIYAITEGKFKFNRKITKIDLALESPYNTYYVQGLPQGPISCPGVKSLMAVVSPAKINAIFFVVNGKGGHNFSDNLADHNRHVESYRSGFK
jgi:UPF0755 protein